MASLSRNALLGSANANTHATIGTTMAQAYSANSDSDTPPGAVVLGRKAWVRTSALTWTYTTARGPGGQHVNKASTAAVLRVAIEQLHGLDEAAVDRLREQAGRALVGDGELLFRCDLHRSQLMNKEACLARLRALVSHAAVRPKVRKKTKPSRGSIERRLESKRRTSASKRNRNWDDD
jgi:ribosome-associated protein